MSGGIQTVTDPIVLTPEQQEGFNLVMDAVTENDPLFRLGGYAGTGKSTVLAQVIDALYEIGRAPMVCAYTGKAATVLRSKGVEDARTIHSTIYRLATYDKEVEGETITVNEWMLKPREDLDGDVFIIDEGSMVGSDLITDLMSYGIPIIVFLDPGQLPPVGDEKSSLFAECDFTLEQIHRQALDSNIIRFANGIRTECFLDDLIEEEYDDLVVCHTSEAKRTNPDIFICGFNSTRIDLNNRVRKRKGFHKQGVLADGERIIALNNDTKLNVFNGLFGTVVSSRPGPEITMSPSGMGTITVETRMAEVLWDGEETPRTVMLSMLSFGRKTLEWNVLREHTGRLVVADYAYAITCHKSQGSEFDNVTVINESFPKLWSQTEWAYTAATRAAKKLVFGDTQV